MRSSKGLFNAMGKKYDTYIKIRKRLLSVYLQIPKYHGVTVRVLVDGSPIRGSNGLYFGPDGNLYIASCWGHEIIKMDPDSGRILARIGQESGVFSPDDLAFGPDGCLYGPIFGQKVIKINVDTDTPIIEDLITGIGISPSAESRITSDGYFMGRFAGTSSGRGCYCGVSIFIARIGKTCGGCCAEPGYSGDSGNGSYNDTDVCYLKPGSRSDVSHLIHG